MMGYLCHAAECQYGGRTWKVYCADKIALPYGPWMLNGAKGVILKAVDSDHDFVFEAVGLTQKSQPVIRYTWSRKTMSKAYHPQAPRLGLIPTNYQRMQSMLFISQQASCILLCSQELYFEQ